jgi:hypothetical protein
VAKWSVDMLGDTFSTVATYRHKKTGGVYYKLYEGLEVTGDEAVPSVVYQNTAGQIFIQAKSRFEDGRFEEL